MVSQKSLKMAKNLFVLNCLPISTVYFQVCVGDCVSVTPDDPTTPLYLARVGGMWETCGGDKEFHATWFIRGTDTVLGETSDPSELFLIDDCEDEPLASVVGTINVRLYIALLL